MMAARLGPTQRRGDETDPCRLSGRSRRRRPGGGVRGRPRAGERRRRSRPHPRQRPVGRTHDRPARRSPSRPRRRAGDPHRRPGLARQGLRARPRSPPPACSGRGGRGARADARERSVGGLRRGRRQGPRDARARRSRVRIDRHLGIAAHRCAARLGDVDRRRRADHRGRRHRGRRGPPGLRRRVLPGIDLVNGDDDADDDNGHGTHVAGIVAATGDNAIGGAGVCWGCRILPVKALGADGSGAYSTLAAGTTWAADHGARVINLSLRGSSDSLTLRSAVRYATDQGIVVIAAAGNSGVSSRFYPAGFDGVVAVGAADRNGARFTFSNYGTDWVDVAAGGCSVSTWPGGGYTSMCGTSMATPFVSGSLGLLLAAVPDATPSGAEAALEATAGPEGAGWTARGMIHLDRAIAALLRGMVPVVTAAAHGHVHASGRAGPDRDADAARRAADRDSLRIARQRSKDDRCVGRRRLSPDQPVEPASRAPRPDAPSGRHGRVARLHQVGQRALGRSPAAGRLYADGQSPGFPGRHGQDHPHIPATLTALAPRRPRGHSPAVPNVPARPVDRSGSSRRTAWSATRPASGRASGRAPGRAAARRPRPRGRSAG